MILIDVEPLYKQYLELEKQARECQMDYLDHCKADSPNVIKWSAILTERTAYKYDLQDAPRVDAVPVVRCKDCKHYVKSDAEHPDCDFCKRLICGVVRPDFFCADGEKRDDNATERKEDNGKA